jgi:hypothetical protein
MLSNVQEITGYLQIYNNGVLTNVEGLHSLTSIEWYLWINTNGGLASVEGLRNLKIIRGLSLTPGGYGIYIDGNAALTTGLPFPALTCKGGIVGCGNTPACINSLSNTPAC